MEQDTRGARFIRGLVKIVFVGCYIAFMWASVHHLATFFDHFESVKGGNTLGSYLLAGAFDVTALVTTTGVMFFRKSMPRNIQIILWAFIIGIALYSFFVNWVYAVHYQDHELIMQPTGKMVPVMDQQGVTHYVPEMEVNSYLLYINPVIASAFTIFALIYSVVGEFFGTKAPSVAELKEKQRYLEETAAIHESIRNLEAKSKGESLIERAKRMAMEGQDALQELKARQESAKQSAQSEEVSSTDPDAIQTGGDDTTEQAVPGTEQESTSPEPEKKAGKSKEKKQVLLGENLPEWLVSSGSTIPLRTVSEQMNISIRTLRNRVESKHLRATKNKEVVYTDSMVSWLKSENYITETGQKPEPVTATTSQESAAVAEQQIGAAPQNTEEKPERDTDKLKALQSQNSQGNTEELTPVVMQSEQEKEPAPVA